MFLKAVRKIFKALALAAFVFCFIILSLVFYYSSAIPPKFYVAEGNEFSLGNIPVLSQSKLVDYNKTSLANKAKGASDTVAIKLFGIIPVTQTHVSVISKQDVTPGGTAFGIKLFTKGVIIVDMTNVDAKSGSVCPGKVAGLAKGDIILTINGQAISTNEELSKLLQNSGGLALNVSYSRDNVTKSTTLTAVRSMTDQTFKGGLWVRDSSAGIGTVTYYNKATGVFAGLGHGICDSDTGKIMPLSSGEVCKVKINGIIKGRSGFPGEIKGAFSSPAANGRLYLNNECGIFGVLNSPPNTFDSVPIKLKQDVHTGSAMILSSLSNEGIKSYAINIDKIDLNPQTLTKNMTITVTDPDLLSKTGGIIQGMSGSPILQDNMLVGAVTHVFVNNPARGYGIFAENMLEYSNELANAS